MQNEDMDAYYRVELSEDGGESYAVLKEWTQENQLEVELPKEKQYKLKVSAKSSVVGEVEVYQIYDF